MAVTPMMQQYTDAKNQCPDSLLFFRLGDFYEMFGDDAKIASKELSLTLTHRQDQPMCGVPYHAIDNYVQKLVKKGYKVSIVDQTGNPRSKGLTERAITKVVTPGTILTDDTIANAGNNYIAIVLEQIGEGIMAAADISTGEYFYGLYDGDDFEQMIFDELYRIEPSEILIDGNFQKNFQKNFDTFIALKLPESTITKIEETSYKMPDIIEKHFSENEIPTSPLAVKAVTILLTYIHNTVMTDLNHISRLRRIEISDRMILGSTTLKNLELVRNLKDGSKRNTLFAILDFTRTASGTRLLKKLIERPLTEILAIERRLDAVEELYKNYSLRTKIRELLKEISDLERLMMKIEIGSANPIDLVALKISLKKIPLMKEAMREVKSDILIACQKLNDYDEVVNLIEKAIKENPNNLIREGGIIRDGYNKELDDYRRIATDSKSLLQEIETREKETTGIKYLKIGYNKVFGYYIEVRHSGKDKIPEHYIRKQTLTGAERYITEELKNFETKILGAQEKIFATEYNLFVEVREEIKKYLIQIQDTARRIAMTDVLASLAETAANYNYIRPEIRTNGAIEIKDGRHPLVERILKENLFVPNDTNLNHKNCELMTITGPNMVGKSTYMRQTALITLMAQIGSFVPAKSASITPVDRIFTRIGASDDLISGQSTFMVEMNEVAQILKYATENSLIILDEVGRGTSTFDGMSIARAVIEYIIKKIHAKTLFATHYHELTDMADSFEKIKNYCVAVKERNDEVIFLRRIKEGGADKSYGIQVAKLAGLPKSVMNRAEKILKELENKSEDENKNSETEEKIFLKNSKEEKLPTLFQSETLEELAKMDVTTFTPIEAMNILYKLNAQAKKELGENN